MFPVAIAAGAVNLNACGWPATGQVVRHLHKPMAVLRYSRRRSDCCALLWANILTVSRAMLRRSYLCASEDDAMEVVMSRER